MKPATFHELDRPWRWWASIIIVSILAFSIAFGFVILPVVQGWAAGIDAYTAICRAVGILPGSPAVQQPTSAARRSPTTRVAWSTELIGALGRARRRAGRRSPRSAPAAMGERGIASDPQNPNLAGQSAVAIYKQLHDYKSGSRVNEIMTGIAQGLNDQQIIDVATHFASGTRRVARSDDRRGDRPGYRAPRRARRPGAQPSGVQFVPRLQCRRTPRDADLVAPEPGISCAAAACLQVGGAPQ